MSGEAADESVELEQLRSAMETRPVIDQAKGVLMAAYGITPEDAWTVLVTVSQHSNTKLHAIAEEIVASTQGGVVEAHLRAGIEAALEQLNSP